MESLGNFINKGMQLSSYNHLNEKMRTLKRKCDTLCSREGDVISELQYVESSAIKKRRNEVEDWLVNVRRTKNGVESIELELAGSRSGFLGRIQLINHVENLTKEVAELMEQGRFCKGLTLDVHDKTIDKTLLTTNLVGQTVQRNLEIIWEHLKNDEVLIIGVWGMGGVGKTSLVTDIYNRVLSDSDSFNHVYWITVAHNPSIHNLQDGIARAIHLDISAENDERKRAAMLSRELAKRRSVLILDDLWDDIRLERVGIVVAVNGCKLVITTRSLEVCRRLNCQEKIKIEPLSEQEAWYLFKKNIGDQRTALSPQVLEVAMHIARECAGLPLGIITVARCMREVQDVHEWRDALQALIESKVGLLEMEEEVFQVLKFSYNRLNDPAMQRCFLYCAMYPEDYRIKKEVLIQHFIDQGLVERRSRQAQFDRGFTILNKLVNSCLLETVECSDACEGVKMHDLIRDMAIKIMCPRSMVKAGMQLHRIPDELEMSGDVERVSLMHNNLGEIASDASWTKCPKLLTLLLSGNGLLRRIESSFFEHLPTLQVLDLSDTGIENFPNSISNLKNLSSLVLCGCRKLQRVPSLAELKSLKRLDLYGSGIREAPLGLEMLVNLTYLDLNVQWMKVFPAGILPKLFRLEYLKFNCSKSSRERVKIKGEELTRLDGLSTFEGHIIFNYVTGFKVYVLSRQRYGGHNCTYYFILDDGYKRVQVAYSWKYNLHYVKLVNGSSAKEQHKAMSMSILMS